MPVFEIPYEKIVLPWEQKIGQNESEKGQLVCTIEWTKRPTEEVRREKELRLASKNGFTELFPPELGYSYSKRYLENLIFAFPVFRKKEKENNLARWDETLACPASYGSVPLYISELITEIQFSSV